MSGSRVHRGTSLAARPGRRATERDDRSTPTRPSRPHGGDCLCRRGSESIRAAGRDLTRSATALPGSAARRATAPRSAPAAATRACPPVSGASPRRSHRPSADRPDRRGPLFLGACPALWPGIAAGERRPPAASSNNSEDIAPSLREQTVDLPALPGQSRSRHRPRPAEVAVAALPLPRMRQQ